MSKLLFHLEVTMDDTAVWDVVADQRDLVRYEAQDFYDPDKRHTMLRFIAYSASVRQGKTRLSWPKFNELCVQVADPEEAGDAVADPTPPGPPGGIS